METFCEQKLFLDQKNAKVLTKIFMNHLYFGCIFLIISLNISHKEKNLLKRVFVSILLLLLLCVSKCWYSCYILHQPVRFYINPRFMKICSVVELICVVVEVVWSIFVCCFVYHCDAWEVFQDHREPFRFVEEKTGREKSWNNRKQTSDYGF